MSATPLGFEPYRIVLDYEALLEGFRDRVEDLDVPRFEINEAGGFTTRYAEKLLCDPPMKTLGMHSLGRMLKATGMALVLVIDDERFAPIRAEMAKRKRRMRPNARIIEIRGYFNAGNARQMGSKRWEGLSDEERARAMRKVARARWRKRKLQQAEAVKSKTPPNAQSNQGR
jgi:hypothetical protein